MPQNLAASIGGHAGQLRAYAPDRALRDKLDDVHAGGPARAHGPPVVHVRKTASGGAARGDGARLEV